MPKVSTLAGKIEGEQNVAEGINRLTLHVPEIYKHLSFKVTPEFHKQFTAWASSHDKSTTALLVDAFKLIQEQES